MADLDEFAMAKLAREMAMAIRNYKDIFADFNITEEEYYEIAKHEFYKRAKEQFALEWNSTLSAAERVKLISASYAEEGLPVVGRRMLNRDEPFTGVMDAFKTLCRNAGIGDPKNPAPNASERFVITINLGADTVEHYDKSVAIDANDISPSPEEIAKDRALSAAIKAKTFKEITNGQTVNAEPEKPSRQFVRATGKGEGA